MSPSAEKALRRHPHTRPKTLIQLEKRDDMTERLRSEIDRASDKRSRMLADSERETVLARLIRKLRRS